MTRAIILTYHAVENGPAPLCIHPDIFRAHVGVIQRSGIEVVTVAALARRLREQDLDKPTLTITFDDGFRSIVTTAGPILHDHGLPATVFCVAGRLGGKSDWPSARSGTFTGALADESELIRLRTLGFELGSHGMQHEPLVGDDEDLVRAEIVGSKVLLEERLGVTVDSFAYPYGAAPSAAAARLVRHTYKAACTTALAEATVESDPLELPRIDSYYVRRPELLEQALEGSLGSYLSRRRLGARARRLVRRDFAPAAARNAAP